MRINKFLATTAWRAGRAWRTPCRRGQSEDKRRTAVLGEDVGEDDEVLVDDRPLEKTEKKAEYYLMNKPKRG